jgi:hypothetical protein
LKKGIPSRTPVFEQFDKILDQQSQRRQCKYDDDENEEIVIGFGCFEQHATKLIKIHQFKEYSMIDEMYLMSMYVESKMINKNTT